MTKQGECFTYGDDDLIFSSEVSLMDYDVTDQVKTNNKKLTYVNLIGTCFIYEHMCKFISSVKHLKTGFSKHFLKSLFVYKRLNLETLRSGNTCRTETLLVKCVSLVI